MSECYKHESRRRQGSTCPYCYIDTLKSKIESLQWKLETEATLARDKLAKLRKPKCHHIDAEIEPYFCTECEQTIGIEYFK